MTNSFDASDYQRYAQAARLVARTHIKLVEALDAELAAFDISTAQYAVMAALVAGRAHTSAQICHELSYDSGAMTRMLDRLERKDLLLRKRSLDDRRTVLVELTAHGQAVYPALLARTNLVLRQFFTRYEGDELEALAALLQKTAIN